jgi:hypothetical protein
VLNQDIVLSANKGNHNWEGFRPPICRVFKKELLYMSLSQVNQQAKILMPELSAQEIDVLNVLQRHRALHVRHMPSARGLARLIDKKIAQPADPDDTEVFILTHLGEIVYSHYHVAQRIKIAKLARIAISYSSV